MRQFKYLRLFKYQSGKTPQWMLDNIDQLKRESSNYITYEIIGNNNPNRIREASLFGIYGTETSVIDPNLVADIDMSSDKGEKSYAEATSDELVDSVLYTDYEDSNDYENNLAYMRYYNGHCEIVFIVDQAIAEHDIYKDETQSDYERVTLVTLEDEDGNVLAATAMSSSESEKYNDGIDTTYMECSSNKIIRILIQRGLDETDSVPIKPYQYLFSDVDLAILELSTVFDYRYSAKWNAEELFHFIDNYQLGALDGSKQIKNKFIQYYTNPIAGYNETINVS